MLAALRQAPREIAGRPSMDHARMVLVLDSLS